MTKHGSWHLPTLLLCAVTLMVSGCGQKEVDSVEGGDQPVGQSHAHDDQGDERADHVHDHHAVPESFAAGVAMLKEHYLEIKAAFESGDGHQAHDALHCVGDLLEALPNLAAAAGLDEEQTQAVQQAIEKVMEAYGTVDAAMHHGDEVDYAAVSGPLDEQMAVLEQAAAGTNSR